MPNVNSSMLGQVQQRLAWFEANPEYKQRWPETYAGLLKSQVFWTRMEPVSAEELVQMLERFVEAWPEEQRA